MSDSFDQQAGAQAAPSPTVRGRPGTAAAAPRRPRPARRRASRRDARAATAAVGAGLPRPRLPRQARSCCKRYQMSAEPDHLRPPAAARAAARARALGPATFLIDRVAEDLAERLRRCCGSSMRAVDLGTPSDAVRRALAASGKVGTIVAATPAPAPTAVAARRRRRGGAAVRRRLARSGRVGAVAAIRQRSARHADPDPARAETGRPVAGRAARRRHARPNCARPSPKPRPRSKAASRRGWRRSPTCATSARCCSAPALRCR